jgi:hypothetical protein
MGCAVQFHIKPNKYTQASALLDCVGQCWQIFYVNFCCFLYLCIDKS